MGGKEVEDWRFGSTTRKQSKSYYRHWWDFDEKISLTWSHLNLPCIRFHSKTFHEIDEKSQRNQNTTTTQSHIEGKLNFPCVLFLMWEIFSSFLYRSRSREFFFIFFVIFFVEQSNFLEKRKREENFFFFCWFRNVDFFSVAMALTPWTTREREWVVCVH